MKKTLVGVVALLAGLAVASVSFADSINDFCDNKYAGGSAKSRIRCAKKMRKEKHNAEKFAGQDIYQYCTVTWGNDWGMVNYCLTRQNEARQSVATIAPSPRKNECVARYAGDYTRIIACLQH